MELDTALRWAASHAPQRRADHHPARHGRAQSSDVAYVVEDGSLLISVTDGRAKTRNMRRDRACRRPRDRRECVVVRLVRRHGRAVAGHRDARRRDQRAARRLLRGRHRRRAPELARVPPGHDRRGSPPRAFHSDLRRRPDHRMTSASSDRRSDEVRFGCSA